MRKAKKVKIRLFGLLKPKSRLLRQKEDQFRSIFSKSSAIRQRSDKEDLHGSTASALFSTSPALLPSPDPDTYVTTVIFITITIRVFELSQLIFLVLYNEFLSLVTI